MKNNQLTKGENRRVMYVENKGGDIDGVDARIGWVTFSKSGRSVYYRGKTLKRSNGGGIAGNHFDEETGEEYWVPGIKKRGSNVHWAESASITVDDDAKNEYERILNE
ncbi:MAG: hypothetical protein COB30_018635 [Ectothiorhodospiraceae bacterium]|nr:hypothetical protein [Ectothiorhodospiraceae bacterium]